MGFFLTVKRSIPIFYDFARWPFINYILFCAGVTIRIIQRTHYFIYYIVFSKNVIISMENSK